MILPEPSNCLHIHDVFIILYILYLSFVRTYCYVHVRTVYEIRMTVNFEWRLNCNDAEFEFDDIETGVGKFQKLSHIDIIYIWYKVPITVYDGNQGLVFC